ncbi:hypothetical protein IQ264_10380 [Phormidium sp. LEGE 05292]|uniref:hypothetical protein n=1 Tax=[Phormidium] sp. LEGE 05292 TaxID=767427 RepID=UPI00187F8643|nr:hypothetical protein [Phormidium sp. LEGE 05292]MBE9225830.1 hypothetical protein [Phormidium sp. LEGE 05292]
MALMKLYNFRDRNDVNTIKAILKDIKSFHKLKNKTSLNSEQIKQIDEDISYVSLKTIPNNYNFNVLKTHADLTKWGMPLPDGDILIAATAITRGLILGSHDSDMLRVTGITVENWINLSS